MTATVWSLLSSLDAVSGGAFPFTGLSLSGVRQLRIEMINIVVTTDGTDIRFTSYAAAAEIVTGWAWALQAVSSGNSANPDSATGAVAGLLCGNDANWDVGNAAEESFSGTVTVDEPGASGVIKKFIYNTQSIGPTGNTINNSGWCSAGSTAAIDGIKISASTSVLVSGRVRLWTIS